MNPICRIYRIELEPGLSNMEISRIGYEFLPIAAGDYEGRSPGSSRDASDYEIGRGEHGKPYFIHRPEIEFNISNSGDWIILAMSEARVGADIQKISDIPLEKVARRVLNTEEYEAFLKMDEKREYFFSEWVLRESYIKWTGEGLSRDMRTLPDDAWQTIIPAPDGYKAAITAAVPLVCVDTEVQYDRQKGFIWTK